ncbi:MAG: 1-deoxy-D-xylulose-5-phosphate reductoisomerase [Erysipelotrichaceae bacterium]
MKKIILLGASGSIGMQSIDVVNHHQDEFNIIALSIGHNINQLHEILKVCHPLDVCVSDEQDMLKLIPQYPNIFFHHGEEGLCELCRLVNGDIVVNALVGFRGLIPSLETIKNHKILALANKESLVAGGVLIKQALKDYKGTMVPIDSEHCAIFQCLQGNEKAAIKQLIITASGGSFRDKSRAELKNVTKQQALNHPNWNMGGRITIDSATMMNKGFEVMEAHYLFDVPYDQIQVLIHRESVVHSMVQYIDESVMAQLGNADMRLPIQYALAYPHRIKLYESEPLDLLKIATLHFEPCDFERYPLLALAYEAGKAQGNAGAIINAADESAVALFLAGKITFLDIEEAIFAAYQAIPFIEKPTLEQLLQSDKEARIFVEQKWRGSFK